MEPPVLVRPVGAAYRPAAVVRQLHLRMEVHVTQFRGVYLMSAISRRRMRLHVQQARTVDPSGESQNGTWELRVHDHGAGGRINSWSATF